MTLLATPTPPRTSESARQLPEQRVILNDVSWEIYDRLLRENDSCSGLLITK